MAAAWYTLALATGGAKRSARPCAQNEDDRLSDNGQQQATPCRHIHARARALFTRARHTYRTYSEYTVRQVYIGFGLYKWLVYLCTNVSRVS